MNIFTGIGFPSFSDSGIRESSEQEKKQDIYKNVKMLTMLLMQYLL